MMLVMKLTTFAWNVYDGRRKVEVCLCAFLYMNNKRGSLKYRSGIGQMASRQKYHKISIRT